MATTVAVDDRALRTAIRNALLVAARKGGAGLQGHLQVKLNVSARLETPGSRSARLRAARAKKRRAARFLYAGSAPGEAPRKRTGTLQKSVAFEVSWFDVGREIITLRVGTNVPYGRWLEYGTRRMAARPWLRPGIAEYLPRLEKVVLTELRRQAAGGLTV